MRKRTAELPGDHHQQHNQQNGSADPPGWRELGKEPRADPQERECEHGEDNTPDQNRNQKLHVPMVRPRESVIMMTVRLVLSGR